MEGIGRRRGTGIGTEVSPLLELHLGSSQPSKMPLWYFMPYMREWRGDLVVSIFASCVSDQ
jgi:hypothetical protein